MVVATLIVLIAAGGWLGYVLRYRIREVRFDRRRERIGEQQWFEVVQESGRKAGPYTQSAFEGVRMIAQFLNGFSATKYAGRGQVTFAWVRSASDPDRLTRLYVGINANAGESGMAALRGYAKSIGARLQPAPRVEFPTENMVVARRVKALASHVRDTVDEIGVVSEAIASVADSAGTADSCAVFITLDGMGRAERSMLNHAIMTGVTKDSHSNSMFAGSAAHSVGLMVEGSVRMSIASANDGGDLSTSQALLSGAITSTSTLGYAVTAEDPKSEHLKDVAIAGAPLLALSGLMFPLGLWPVALLGLAALAAGFALALTWREAVEGPMERAAERGAVLMPDHVPGPLSVRRGVQRVWLRSTMRSRESADGNSEFDPSPFPSPDEVLSGHSASLFELATFPTRSATSLTAADRLQSRGLPPNMVDVDNGIFIGASGTGQPVFLDLDDIHYSLYTAGAPNSGKSNLLLVMFAGVVKAARDRTAGMRISPIWGETKGEGAYDAWKIARHCPGAIFVDVHNPFPYGGRLALEGRRLSEGESVPNVVANCTRLVSSLQAAYGDGIKSQAREIFDNVLRCAMLMTAEEIEFVGLGRVEDGINTAKPNIIELSYYLLLGDSRIDPTGKMISLGGTLSRSDGLRERYLSDAIGSMSRFWEKETRRTYQERMSTVLNKINDLRNARLLWTPDSRQDVYVGQLVESFAPSVINMGSYYDAATGQFNQSIDRSVSQRLIRSFNYLLWDYIKARCNGWQAEGKRVPMFFDEVADVASNAEGDDVPNPLEEGTKEGRSRGAAYFLGSQYPSQMPQMVRHQVLASRGKFWFGLQYAEDLTLAVSDLMVDESDAEGAITASSIKALSNGVCFATLPRHNTVTPPLLLRVPHAPPWIKVLFAPENADTNDAVADWMEQLEMEEAV